VKNVSATRVLIVEDERIVALHLKQQLVQLGYDVPIMVASGEKALKHIIESPPDVVLMDIHIEGQMDGIETAAQIPEELHVPIIYLTAYSEEATLNRARSTRAYGYLLKPFSARELHATIQMVLERCRADMALRENERRLERMVEARNAELIAAMQELKEQTAERLKVQEALRHAQKMEAIGRLTGGVAHDFNNLLTVVGGGLDLIRGDPGNVARVERLAESAMTAVERCERLIKQLLMFGRRQLMHPKVADPNGLIADFEMLIRQVVGINIHLAIKLSPTVHLSKLDRSQFEAALLNIVMNAHDAISGSGRIIIETRNVDLGPDYVFDNREVVPGSYVMVAVSDNGQGIPPDALEHVFDPFFTTKEIGRGSGLGLSQVYGFAKESGGHVKIYSEPGVGTTVRLYLPRAGEARSEAPMADIIPQRHRARSGETVLIVEDDEPVLAMAVEGLKTLGYRVLTAYDAVSAIEILGSDESIDILFSDVVMPGTMNGVQLAIEARRLRPTIKVLLTSGYTASALTEHGLQGNMPLLEKPYRLQDLAAPFNALGA
jgi:signal transduction histidine kinase